MPEGPEIRRAADKIEAAIARRPIAELWFAFDHLQPYAAQLEGQQITHIETRGKAMLTHFEGNLSIYSHNQLYGKWMVRRAYNYPQTNRQLRLAIHTAQKSALLYSASDIEVLDAVGIASHPFLQRLGPDVLSTTTTLATLLMRLNEPAYQGRRLSTLLLDQHFLAGLGNYLRSEILFVARLHPAQKLGQCTPDQREALAKAILMVTRQSYETGGITNDLTRVDQLKAKGCRRSRYRHWVFGRVRQSCYVCQTEIIKEFTNGRRYYYCPSCQSA